MKRLLFLLLVLLLITSCTKTIKEVSPQSLVEWLDNCKVRKVGDTYNTIIGRTFYANDSDGICKPIEKAMSLKNSNIKCVVTKEKESDPDVECLDYNLTWVKLDIKDKDKKYKVVIYEEGNKSKIKLDKTKEKLDKTKEKLDIVELNINFGDEIHIGENSTTIQLQDANTEILDDATMSYSSNSSERGLRTTHYSLYDTSSSGYDIMAKINISAAPQGLEIITSEFCMLISNNYLDLSGEGFNVSNHLVYSNFTVGGEEWVEGNSTEWTVADGAELNWNDRPTTGYYDESGEDVYVFFGGAGEPSGWICWNSTKMVNFSYEQEHPNITIWFKSHSVLGDPSATDSVEFRSKDTGTSSNRPYLNITFSQSIPTTPTSIVCNDGTCDTTFTSNIVMNCSGSTDEESDTITYLIKKGNLLDDSNTTPQDCIIDGSASTNSVSCSNKNEDETDATYDSCEDGSDESEYMWIENVYVNATLVQMGEKFNVICEVCCYGSDTEYGIVYDDGTGWVVQDYGSCSGGTSEVVCDNLQNMTVEITASNANGTHYVRCWESYSTCGSGTTCCGSTYADNDDMAIEVGLTNYTDVGNHTGSNTYTWDISSEPDETYERMRCRAIDLAGSNMYSSYYTISTALVIDYGVTPTVEGSAVSSYLKIKKRYW